ncbi:alpha/beta fold hydrolase [Caballeronia insecticola]|nr:alpha/beta hydrolase [Caballeronia insecticola]
MQPRLKQVSVLGRGGFHKLAYVEWGPAKAERTVICLHGISRTGRDFDMLAAALAEAGVRVVAPDLPGHGRSDWLESSAHYTDRAYTRALTTLIARLDVEQVDWIGTSFGAHIGMLMASEPGTPVRRLVLNDFGALVSAAALRRVGVYLKRSWRFASIDEVDAHLREVHAMFGTLSDAQWRHLAEHSAVPDGTGGFRFRFDPGIGLRFAFPIWLDVDLWHVWEKIGGPVLILRGEHSDLLARSTVGAMLRRGLASSGGRVAAFEFPDCGHAPALMDDAQIAVVKDYLT